MTTTTKVLSVENLKYYHSLAEGVFAGSIEIAGQSITFNPLRNQCVKSRL